jgi:hypothetical protein
MLPKLDNIVTVPVVATAQLRSTASVADPRLDAMMRLDQIALAKTLPGQLAAQGVNAASLAREQSAALTLANPTTIDETTLSAAGRLIDSFLHSRVDGQQHKALPATQPLLATAITDSPQLASQLSTQLQKVVEHSGVFYESHLQQWSNGERSLAALQAEPQNQPSTLPTEAAQWVSAQLNAQEQQRFAWQGQAWPGQAMQWQVQPDPKNNSGATDTSADEKKTAWNSVLQLDFPGLGKVSATLRLVGDHVQMQMRTQDEASTAALKAQGEVLSQSLKASGTTLDSLTVHRDDHA